MIMETQESSVTNCDYEDIKDLENDKQRLSDEETEDLENWSPNVKSESEIRRERNIKERDALFESFLQDPQFADAINAINSLNDSTFKKEIRSRKRKREDENFTANIGILQYIGLERRQSLRLRNKSPVFSENDLVDERSFTKHNYLYKSDSDIEDLEDVVYKVRVRRSGTRTAKRVIIPVEEVTESMINNIAKKVSIKKYSENGTSCHQCRQKTLDQKTCCRNVDCVGTRGQFCGVCLENRYGQNAAEALKDPNWNCPVCKGFCNCSFCRARAGKRPTGILTPLAHQNGYKSVKEFLDSLKGKGDYADKIQDPRNLLGFDKDLKYAQMGGGIKHSLTCPTDLDKFRKICENMENKLKAELNFIQVHKC